MSKIYIISGSGGGGCRCGHLHMKGDVYYLVEGEKRGAWTLCQACGENKRLKGRKLSIDEMQKRWFGDRSAVDALNRGRE